MASHNALQRQTSSWLLQITRKRGYMLAFRMEKAYSNGAFME